MEPTKKTSYNNQLCLRTKIKIKINQINYTFANCLRPLPNVQMILLVLLSTPRVSHWCCLPTLIATSLPAASPHPLLQPWCSTRIPLTLSLLCLFVLTSLTAMLAAPSILQLFSHGAVRSRCCRWHGPPPTVSTPPHSLVHTCGQAQLRQYKHTESLHSYTPFGLPVCLASTLLAELLL